MAHGFLPLPLAPPPGPSVRNPNEGALTISSVAPTVLCTDNHFLLPAAAQLVLERDEPFALVKAPGQIIVPAAQLELTRFAPAGGRGSWPAVGQLTLSAQAPSVARTTHVNLSPDAAQLVAAANPPLVVVDYYIPALYGDHIYLVHVQSHDGTQILTRYFSTDGFTSVASDIDTVILRDENEEVILDENDEPLLDGFTEARAYEPRVIDPGSFQRRLGFLESSSTSSGDVVVASGDPGNGAVLDDLLTQGFGNRDIVILAQPRNEKMTENAVTVFRGKIKQLRSSDPLDRIEFEIADRLADLEFPLLNRRFDGSTTSSAATAEGNEDLKGQIKKRVWGQASSVLLQPANPYDLIYHVSDSELVSVTVYDGGLPLINDGDHAGIIGLRGATIAGGHYATCLDLGLIRVGGTPVFNLTADVIEGDSSTDRTAAQIAYRMLIEFGVDSADIDIASFAALDGLNSSTCYAVIDDERSALEAVQQVLQSIGGWILPNQEGEFEVGRYGAPTAPIFPSLRMNAELQVLQKTLQLLSNDVPVWRVIVEYNRVHHVQEDDALAGSVTAARRAFLGAEYRTVTAEDSSIKTKHMNAREITVNTQLNDSVAAQAEANRLLEVLSTERSTYQITTTLADGYRALPGRSLSLTHPRLGMSAGKNFLVIAREDRFADEQIVLTIKG